MEKTQAKIGDLVEVEVIGLQEYGAFVRLLTNADQAQANGEPAAERKGLIHISEVRSGYTKNIRDYIKVGQHLTAQIIDIDEYTGKISLSMRTLDKAPASHHVYRKKHFTDSRQKIGFAPLAERLPGWTEENEAYLAAGAKDASQA